ncbi:putative Kinesin motor domain-containing protein [Seiridium cardinale]|uniref:Kinesin-like protein n=1 Tax=Seiridium cardinale TaxID=138064 RepID=A0ABR2Y2P0_9PEZI
MDTENPINKPSGLPRPGSVAGTSRLPQSFSASTSHQALHEITESQTNTRSQYAMGPPSLSGIKRGAQGLVTQPDPKRKTLAERGGTEFPQATSRSGLVAPTPARNLRGTSLRDMQSARPGTRSVASYSSNTSRNTSNTSCASSIGPGGRPPSQPSHTRSTSVRSTASKNSRPGSRPVTSMGVRAEEQSKNGTTPTQRLAKKPNFSSRVPITRRKPRKCHSVNDMGVAYTQPFPTAGEASICQALTSLSLGRTSTASSQEDQTLVVSDPDTPTPSFKRPSNVTVRDRRRRVDELGSPVREQSRDCLVVPNTPTHEDVMQQFARMDSSWKAAKIPMMSPSPAKLSFLTKDSNLHNFVAWDVDERLGTFESEFKAMKEMINNSMLGQKTLEDDVAAVREKASALEQIKTDLESTKSELQSKLDDADQRIYILTRELDDEKRARRNDAEDLMREHRNDIDNRTRQFNREKDEMELAARRKLEMAKDELAGDFAKKLEDAHNAFEELEKLLEDERRNATLRSEANGKDMEAQFVQLEEIRRERDEARRTQMDLKGLLAVRDARIADLERQVMAGQTALIHLKGDEQKQLDNFRIMREEKQAAVDEATDARKHAEEYKSKLIVEERRRRKLFEQLQTLKGNIRVMCRIRPGRNDTGNAQIETDVGDYDDHIGKMTVMVPTKKYNGEELLDKNYDFERVFTQNEGNKVVFEEISQLVQSALDGQKVCIFCYGQTGSGKTFTMSSEGDSIIPSAMKMIYEQAEALKDAGWTYQMWGSFTEVYNEKLYDLLGEDGSRNEVELRQDPAAKKFYVDSRATRLSSPEEVERMLATAFKNRSVAATKMNRASSRSHCVFTLKLEGVDVDGNKSEGVLNLIDLAGSERVKESQVEGQNFKEAASINTSLSTLSKVMTALAENAGHIPYRDSALTKLLEGCLGGNSKALMFVMVSPLAVDIKETVSSLDFATTVSKAKPGQQGGALKAIKTGRSGALKKR